MKKIIFSIAIFLTSLSAKIFDKNKIYFDLCTGECFKIIATDGQTVLKYRTVKCQKEQLRYINAMQNYNK